MRGTIILSHGADSGPDATKVSALAACADARGWQTRRPDYRADDVHGYAGSVAPRLARLRAAIEACAQPPLLVGSSMGAFVCGLASLRHAVAGLFLLAAPRQVPGVDDPLEVRRGVPTQLIHGWRDALCPVDDIIAFARQRQLPLLALDDDHRLGASLPLIERQFVLFLEACA